MIMPPVTLGLSPSFGFGDRIGLATSGHVLSMKQGGAGIRPIFAQQSIREMTRTGRSPQQVMEDAITGMRLVDYEGQHGADADHLKTTADVDRTAEAGFTFFTIDPSEKVDGRADGYSLAEIDSKFRQVAAEVDWIDKYQKKTITLPNGTRVKFTEQDCRKAAVKYGRAINLAESMARHIAATVQEYGRDYEIELSIDETPQPTTLAEHYIIAEQVLSRGMKMVSLAPRFIGEFEKGVDYKGDLRAFERSLADHAAIAQMLGPYKLSLHSGSDKLSIYGLLARYTQGRFHVKTAGTSYLEALRVVARKDAALFRRIISFARGRFDVDKASYHVSATLASAPAPTKVENAASLEKFYLGRWSEVPSGKGLSEPGRQILHCTFGSVLTDPVLKGEVRGLLEQNRTMYEELLVEHFGRHLAALQAGWNPEF